MTPERNVTLYLQSGRYFCLRDDDFRNIGLDPDAISDEEFELVRRELQRIFISKFQKFFRKAAKRSLGRKYCPFYFEDE